MIFKKDLAQKKLKLFKDAKFTFIPVILCVILLYTAGCGSNSVTNPLTSNVTFKVTQQNGTSGVQFYGKPSVDVKLTRVISTLPAQNFFDTVNNQTPNYVFSKDTAYYINEFNGVASGQKWTIYFTGSTVSGSTAYSVSTDYTVP